MVLRISTSQYQNQHPKAPLLLSLAHHSRIQELKSTPDPITGRPGVQSPKAILCQELTIYQVLEQQKFVTGEETKLFTGIEVAIPYV